MGHKVHPKGFRLAFTHAWSSSWFSKDQFSVFLREDIRIREFLHKQLREALLDRIEIDRARQSVVITLYSAKPGMIIGRSGAGIEELNKKLRNALYCGKRVDIKLNVKEVPDPSLSARIVGLQIVQDIEKRMPYRRSMKQAMDRVLKSNALGVRVCVSGRLNGTDIARTEALAKGKVPLHNLRSDINFASVTAHTLFGAIGVKVWINRGEMFEETTQERVPARHSVDRREA